MKDVRHGRLPIRPRRLLFDAAWKRAINPENDGPASIDAGPSSMTCKQGFIGSTPNQNRSRASIAAQSRFNA